ncbi:uncharacterized protein N7529_007681 [Penicillium soppii]|jgi:hypothetical protein|uniref:uncharacterized protein n=1 Tax=Penicillium soppii TaxID=69789 RepID=UPI002546F82F|nr:uncharacterized protein N7529_007681 [Penicillium soppii]KAJ5860371.1 hypothetical protein N7529_007681 [Penicillium soppii]
MCWTKDIRTPTNPPAFHAGRSTQEYAPPDDLGVRQVSIRRRPLTPNRLIILSTRATLAKHAPDP